MRKWIKSLWPDLVCMLAIAIMASGIAACSTLGNGKIDSPDTAKLAVQYGTLKLIEQSDSVDGQAVLDRTAKLRAYVEADSVVDLARLRAEAEGLVNWDSLDASDRLLVLALFDQIETTAERTETPTELEATLLQILDWAEQAARIYAN